jgi:hypothetical protein
MMKFQIEERVGEVRGDQLAERRCYNISMKKVSDLTALTVDSVSEAKGNTQGGGCRGKKSPADRNLPHSRDLRRPREFPPQEHRGVHLVT